MDLTVIYLFLLNAVCVTIFIERLTKRHHVYQRPLRLTLIQERSGVPPDYWDGLCNAFQFKAK